LDMFLGDFSPFPLLSKRYMTKKKKKKKVSFT